MITIPKTGYGLCNLESGEQHQSIREDLGRQAGYPALAVSIDPLNRDKSEHSIAMWRRLETSSRLSSSENHAKFISSDGTSTPWLSASVLPGRPTVLPGFVVTTQVSKPRPTLLEQSGRRHL